MLKDSCHSNLNSCQIVKNKIWLQKKIPIRVPGEIVETCVPDEYRYSYYGEHFMVTVNLQYCSIWCATIYLFAGLASSATKQQRTKQVFITVDSEIWACQPREVLEKCFSITMYFTLLKFLEETKSETMVVCNLRIGAWFSAMIACKHGKGAMIPDTGILWTGDSSPYRQVWIIHGNFKSQELDSRSSLGKCCCINHHEEVSTSTKPREIDTTQHPHIT